MACTTKSIAGRTIKRRLNVIGKQECIKVRKLCDMQNDNSSLLSDLTETMDLCNKSIDLDTSKRNTILSRNDSGYKSDESFSDEDDVICTNDVSMKVLNYGHFSADAWTTEMRCTSRAPPSDKKPDQSSELLIHHRFQTDTKYGDRFGATLRTYNQATYYQHFLVDIKEKGPAYSMKLRDNDELLLINNIFVPNKTHTDVLNLFHNVPVDGKTKFCLIIRRIESLNCSSRRKPPDWKWYESSAILSQDRKELFPHLVGPPDFNSIKDNAYEHDYRCKLIVSVKQEQHCLQISDIDGISLNRLKSRNATSDTVTKSMRCNPNQETGIVEIEWALSNMNKTHYVAVMPDKVDLQNEPVWCQSKMDGAQVWFKFQDVYLACNTITGTVQANSEEFFFDEYPASASLEEYPHGSYDCPDSSQECAPISGLSFGGQPALERDQCCSMSVD